MYFTLPHLKEHFENMPTKANKEEISNELENTVDEYDLEKKTAIYVKFQLESDALKLYRADLEKEHMKIANELARIYETHSIERAKCSSMEKEYLKLKRDYEVSLKEKQASIIIEEQLKKQLTLNDTKNVENALDERQEQKKALEKKLADIGTKMAQEYEIMNNLKIKLSKDEHTLTQLKKQRHVMEHQMAQDVTLF